MRKTVIVVLALAGFILFPILARAQDSKDKTWPILGSPKRLAYEAEPRFIVYAHKLEIARNVINPLFVTRCRYITGPCKLFLSPNDFYSRRSFPLEAGVLRADVLMQYYPNVVFDWHRSSDGTYVYYLPEHNVFYLYGNCMMNHADEVEGPFVGDPRLVLKKLAEEPDAVAQLGMLTVPFNAEEQAAKSRDDTWPTIIRNRIDISKLKPAQGVLNPLLLDRCLDSYEQCVMEFGDFSHIQKVPPDRQDRVLRPGIVAHFYPGPHQYVFYLPKKKIFYVTGYNPPFPKNGLAGPFAGDPRVALKQFADTPKVNKARLEKVKP